jgi:Ni/Co efflux regulator RcnB
LRKRRETRARGEQKSRNEEEEKIVKYFVAMCLLAVPFAMSAAPTPAEAGQRNTYSCHWVKKTTWSHGHKRTRWVKKCEVHHNPRHKH